MFCRAETADQQCYLVRLLVLNALALSPWFDGAGDQISPQVHQQASGLPARLSLMLTALIVTVSISHGHRARTGERKLAHSLVRSLAPVPSRSWPSHRPGPNDGGN